MRTGCRVSDHSAENQMTAHNLSIVIAPSLMWSSAGAATPSSQLSMTSTTLVLQGKLVQQFITDQQRLFSTTTTWTHSYYSSVLAGKNTPSPSFLNFSTFKKFIHVGKLSYKNTKFGSENTLILKKFGSTIKVLSTRYLLCRKFAAVGQKIVTICPPYFL